MALVALVAMLLPTYGFTAVDQEIGPDADVLPPSGRVQLQTTPGTTSQTFTPDYPTLAFIDIYLETNDGNATENNVMVTLDVYRLDELSASATDTVTVLTGFTSGWQRFDFTDLLVTTSPQEYLIDVYVDDAGEGLSWSYHTPDTYVGGVALVENVAQETYDFLFRTWLDDISAPMVAPVVTPASSTAPWWSTNVRLEWDVIENESPIVSLTLEVREGGNLIDTLAGCPTIDIVEDQPVREYRCIATSVGGGPVSAVANIGRDTVKPVITATRTPANANGWNDGTVTIMFSCDDNAGLANSGATHTFPPTVDVSSPGAGQSVLSSDHGQCVDAAGNVADPITVSDINIDLTPPNVTMTVIAGQEGNNGWYITDPTIRTTGSDPESPIVSCSPDFTQTANTLAVGADIPGTCTNAAGLVGNATFNVKLDKLAPTVTLTPSGTTGDNGWYISDVDVTTSGNDAHSDIASCTALQEFTTESTGFFVNGSCTDNAGNVGSAAPLQLKIDKTAPTSVFISVVDGELGDNGWYVTDVTVRTMGTDSISPVTCTADQFLTTDTGPAGVPFTGSCENEAGLITLATPLILNIKLDKTAPTVTLTPSGGLHNGWYNTNVVVDTTGTDAASGVSDADCTPDQVFSADSPGFTVNGSCTDVAGNVGHAAQLTLKIDQTPPVTTVAPILPFNTPDGANGWFITGPVTIDTSATDLLSGVDDADCTANQVFASDTAGTTVNGTCTDEAGNSSSSSYLLKLDTTDPLGTILVTGGTEGRNGWYTSTVIATAFATDNVSGEVECVPILQSLTVETTGTNLSSICTNQAGRTDTPSILVKIDKTPPVTTLSTLPAAPNGTNGWFTSDVSVLTGCDETISTPPNWNPPYGTAPQVISTETAGLDVNGTCTNLAGLSSSDTIEIKLDKTGPTGVILEVTSGTLGDNGWYTTDIVVSTSGTDNISGPVVCTADQPWTLEADDPGQEFNGSCTNQAGLTTDADPIFVKVDKTAPTDVVITPTGTLGNNGWYTSDVVLTTTGVEDVSDPMVCTPEQTLQVDTVGQTFNGSCENDAGLVGPADPVTIMLDKTPPTLTVTMPAAVALNAVVSATPDASDATSGIASVSCDPDPVDTSTTGTHSVTCTAEDNAGNVTEVTVEYQVLSTVPGSGDCGEILFGTLPPAGGGYGTFAFSCGTLQQLLDASGCPQSTAVFFYNAPGSFLAWIPGSNVAAVNQAFLATFNGNPQIPVNTIFTAKCR